MPAGSSTASRPKGSITRWSPASWPPAPCCAARRDGARSCRRARGAPTCARGSSEIGAELRDSVLIQRYLFHSPARMDRVVRGARTRPEFSRILVDYASGRFTYRAARRQLLWHFPRLLPRLAGWPRGRSGIIRNPNMAESGIFRTPALQGWQRTNVVAAANCLREQMSQRRTIRSCAPPTKACSICSIPRASSRASSASRPRPPATPRRRSRTSAAAERRAAERRKANLGPPPASTPQAERRSHAIAADARRPCRAALRSRRHAVRSSPLRARRAEEVHGVTPRHRLRRLRA